VKALFHRRDPYTTKDQNQMPLPIGRITLTSRDAIKMIN